MSNPFAFQWGGLRERSSGVTSHYLRTRQLGQVICVCCCGLMLPSCTKQALSLLGQTCAPASEKKKKYYQMWRAGQRGGCVWTRLITDTPVGRKDVKAVANPAAVYGAWASVISCLKSPAEAHGFDHTYTVSSSVLNLGGKVSFAAVMRHFSRPTSHQSPTSSAMVEPAYVCMICCEFNERLSLAIPYPPQFLRQCISLGVWGTTEKDYPLFPLLWINHSYLTFELLNIQHITLSEGKNWL